MPDRKPTPEEVLRMRAMAYARSVLLHDAPDAVQREIDVTAALDAAALDYAREVQGKATVFGASTHLAE